MLTGTPTRRARSMYALAASPSLRWHSRKLNLPIERVVSTIARHGNTSAASIPLALAEAVGDGRIKQGDLILTEAMGGGLTWGAALIRW